MFSMLRIFLLVPVPYSYLVSYYSTVLYSNIQDQNIPSMILTSDILEIQFILLPKLAGIMRMHILHFEKGQGKQHNLNIKYHLFQVGNSEQCFLLSLIFFFIFSKKSYLILLFLQPSIISVEIIMFLVCVDTTSTGTSPTDLPGT